MKNSKKIKGSLSLEHLLLIAGAVLAATCVPSFMNNLATYLASYSEQQSN